MTLDALSRPSGTFLMVAMDQRESLRTMLAQHHAEPIADERLVAFKLAVARELAPYASGFLIDRHYGFDDVVRRRLIPPGCGLILAADALVQPPGGVVEDTDLDTEVDPLGAAVALKLLVIWRDDDERARRVETSRRFVELAREHGLVSVLEGVVRTAPEEREDAIVEAARELSAVGPSLYKCEVPLHGRGDPDEITRRCREIDAALEMPWVVLSQGVDPDDFPRAVAAACRGGASGMLAGRAIWTATLAAADPTELLREHSVPRLQELATIVDEYGRPWREKLVAEKYAASSRVSGADADAALRGVRGGRGAGGPARRGRAGRGPGRAPGDASSARCGALVNAIAFTTANFVARETGYAMHGWGHGDRETNERFRPVDTYEERLDGVLADVAALGFDTVDVWGAHLHPDWATDEHVAIALKSLARHGLRVSTYAAWIEPRTVARACELAARLGTDLIGAGASGDVRGLAPTLRAQGIRLAFENHPERSPQELLAKLDDTMGVTLDTGWFATQGYDPVRAIEELGDRVLHVHLKDVLAVGEPHETCPWGLGIVPVEDCVRALVRIGYAGVLTIEHEPEDRDPTDEIREMLATLHGWLG